MNDETQLLKEFEHFANEMAAVGDVKAYMQANKADCWSKIAKVIQYKNYIKDHCEPMIQNQAKLIFSNMINQNPSLYNVFVPSEKKDFDVKGIETRINQVKDEYNQMRGIDTEIVEDCKSKLMNIKEKLERNRNSMKSWQFAKLHNEVSVNLYRIDQVMMKLEEVQGTIKGM